MTAACTHGLPRACGPRNDGVWSATGLGPCSNRLAVIASRVTAWQSRVFLMKTLGFPQVFGLAMTREGRGYGDWCCCSHAVIASRVTAWQSRVLLMRTLGLPQVFGLAMTREGRGYGDGGEAAHTRACAPHHRHCEKQGAAIRRRSNPYAGGLASVAIQQGCTLNGR